MNAMEVRSFTDAGGRRRPAYGEAERHYHATGDRGPLDEYWRVHKAQESSIRRAAKRKGLRAEWGGTACSNVVSVWDGSRRVAFGGQDMIEAWLAATTMVVGESGDHVGFDETLAIIREAGLATFYV